MLSQEGVVDRLNLDRGFGFIAIPQQPDVFFHFRALTPPLLFDEQLTGRRVLFTTELHDGRHRATRVEAIE